MDLMRCNWCEHIFFDNTESSHCPSCGRNDYLMELSGFEEYDDTQLERLWDLFGDISMNPETECMEDVFLCFPVDTFREDIWRWFDKRHSRGVAFLMGI